MKTIVFLLCMLLLKTACAQNMGIGTDFPDVNSILEMDSNNKGLLIPRMTTPQRTAAFGAIGAAQEGLLIYNTTTDLFNYWDGSQWLTLPGSDPDWFLENSTVPPTANTDDIYHSGNVGIGMNNPAYKLEVEENSANRAVNIVINSSGNGTDYGIYNSIESDGSQFGIYNRLEDMGFAAFKYGTYNLLSSSGGAFQYGSYNRLVGTAGEAGGGFRFGSYQIIENSMASIQYGSYNYLTTASPSPSGFRFGSFQRIEDAGGSFVYGSYNSILTTTSASASYGEYNLVEVNTGTAYGCENRISGTSISDKYGVSATIDTSSGGGHFAIYGRALKVGPSTWAGYFLGDVYVGSSTTDGYELPPTDGTASQLMQTDGSGQATWVDPSTIFTEDQDWLEEGLTTAPDANTDNMFTLGNVGIGEITPTARIHVQEDGTAGLQTIVAVLESNISNRPVLLFSEGAAGGINSGMSIEYNGVGTGANNRIVINDIAGNPSFEFQSGADFNVLNGDIVIEGTAADRELKMDDDAGNDDRVLMRQTGTQDIYVGDIDNNNGDVYIRAGGVSEMIIENGGQVGINTLTPGWDLEVNGNAAKPGGGAWTASSDRRLKQNISDYQLGLKSLLKIRPVSFQYNETSGFDISREYVGVVAQELQKVAPSMVLTYEKDGVEYLAVDNSEMTYMLINAIKELNARIESLEQQLEQQPDTSLYKEQ